MRPTAPRRSEASSIDVSETDFSIFPPVSSTPGSAGLFLNASSGKSTDAARARSPSFAAFARGGLGGFILPRSKTRNAASGSDASSSESSVSASLAGHGSILVETRRRLRGDARRRRGRRLFRVAPAFRGPGAQRAGNLTDSSCGVHPGVGLDSAGAPSARVASDDGRHGLG